MISVIVPVHNSEKYLDKCVSSILNQTYSNIELILVEDGSTDNSAELCDSYLKDGRVKTFHNMSSGLAEARNVGLDNATGEYIAFCDADDYYALDAFEKMIHAMEADAEIDMVECRIGFLLGETVENFEDDKDIVCDGIEALSLYFNNKDKHRLVTAVWSKLFRRSFWETRRFPIVKRNEDYFLTVQSYGESRKFCHLKETGYYYRKDNYDSLTKQQGIFNFDMFLETQNRNIVEYCKKKSEVLYKTALKRYYLTLLSLSNGSLEHHDIKEYQNIKNKLWKNKRNIYMLDLNFKERWHFRLYYFNPKLYMKIVYFRVKINYK